MVLPITHITMPRDILLNSIKRIILKDTVLLLHPRDRHLRVHQGLTRCHEQGLVKLPPQPGGLLVSLGPVSGERVLNSVQSGHSSAESSKQASRPVSDVPTTVQTQDTRKVTSEELQKRAAVAAERIHGIVQVSLHFTLI